MKCPKCNKLLDEIDIVKVMVDGCLSCGGIFYANKELQKLIIKTFEDSSVALDNLLKLVDTNKSLFESKKECPKDGQIMNNIEFPKNSKIIIDFCPKCKGIWTDHEETEKILKYCLKHKPKEKVNIEELDVGQTMIGSIPDVLDVITDLFN